VYYKIYKPLRKHDLKYGAYFGIMSIHVIHFVCTRKYVCLASKCVLLTGYYSDKMVNEYNYMININSEK
jgi:hypothetical protein